jgi:hypothetical protein
MLRITRLAFSGLCAVAAARGAAVHVWQDSIELPTYAEHDPDPAPEFAAFVNPMANYPYPVRSHPSALTSDRSPVAWRTLNLENEYLLCRILPDLGGHLYNCRDKLSKREVFYANPVIKKDLIGLRGAWIATGIESNFPATHSRVSASPVNFAIRNEADGAAGVIVADTDRVTGMQWRVEYRLRPGAAVLEQQVSLYNPASVRKPYLWWSNAEVEWDDPGIRYVFPATLMLSHDRKTLETWPVNSAGVDMSQVANDPVESTWFAYQTREPFMAVYKPASKTGVAHYADARVVTGKKIWIMGRNELESYRGRLTDNANLYVEMQAGLFADQQTYEFLEPQQSRTFTEYWIPFRGLDGVTRVTPDLVLYANRPAQPQDKSPAKPQDKSPAKPQDQSKILIELNATHAIGGARVRIIAGGRVISEATADLDPAAVWTRTVEVGAGAYSVQVLDSSGRPLLEHSEGLYAAAGPSGFKPGPQKLPDWNGRENEWLLFRRGESNELQSQDAFAQHDYGEALQRFPRNPVFEKAQGRLALSLLRSGEAAERLDHVLTVNGRPDSESLYYAGVAQTQLGHDQEALPLLARVGGQSAFASAASLESALIAARLHDYPSALKLTGPLAGDPGRAARIAGLRAAILRRAGDPAAALRELERGRAAAPEDPFLRYEGTLAGSGDPALWSYLAGDAERVLNIADEYFALGLLDDALTLLKHDYSGDNPHFFEPGAVPPERSALLAYYRAYCEDALKIDPAGDLRRASGLGTRYQFTNRATSYPVLRAAIEREPSDATAHALLGNLELYSLRIQDAVAELGKAVSLNPKLEIERKSLAEAIALLKRGPAESPVVSGNAASPAPAEPAQAPRSPATLAPKAAPDLALSRTPTPVSGSPTELAEAAMLRATSGAIQEASDVFRTQTFSSDKQPLPVRRAYIEVQLQKLLALSDAGKCQGMDDRVEALGLNDDRDIEFTLYGFGQFIRAAHFQYYLGVVEANCGLTRQANRYWSRAAKMREPASSPDFAYPALADFRLNAAGAKAQATEAMRTLESAGGTDPGVRILNRAVLLRALGQEGAALAQFTKAAQESKEMFVQYLAAVELTRKRMP